jgi:Sec-independent protein secretion pathway component TatC
MKTAAKVFIILGMIFGFYMIFPIVLGAIALKKLKAANCKADFSTGWSIVVLLLVNLIAGILLLVMKDEDFQKA